MRRASFREAGGPLNELAPSTETPTLLQLLLDSVQDYAIYMLDPTGHIATWNAGAQRIKGYTANEIIG